MPAHAFDRPNLLSRMYGSVIEMVAAAALLAFAVMTIEGASAHDKGCDGNPVPVAIKLDCCGQADEHRLTPKRFWRTFLGSRATRM